MGTIGEIGLAFTGIDFLLDGRDLLYDIIHLQDEEIGAGEIILDGVGLLPIVGLIGKADNIAVIFKHSDDFLEIANVNRLTQLLEIDNVLYLKKALKC